MSVDILSPLPNSKKLEEEYEFVVSLGYDCQCAMNLRRLGLRSCSSPFDWLTNAPIDVRLGLLESHFAGFIEKTGLRKLDKGPNPPGKGNDHYQDVGTGLCFYHDFREDLPFDESYAMVKEKYDRRIARLYRRVAEARRTLFVWRDYAHPLGPGEVREAESRLQAAFPDSNVTLLVVGDDGELLKIKCPGAEAQRRRIKWLRLWIRLFTWPHLTRAGRSIARRKLEKKWGLE